MAAGDDLESRALARVVDVRFVCEAENQNLGAFHRLTTAVEGMTMNDSRPPKPKHRWYQFNLRTLLVLVTVVCVFLGLFEIGRAHV